MRTSSASESSIAAARSTPCWIIQLRTSAPDAELLARGQIAVIYGTGEIERGKGGYDPLLSPDGTSMGADTMAEAFKAAREDDAVRAVVFRINSPGGSVVASELIRRQVELTARKKPVIVSMSGYAASGGYWVATPAGKIFADAGTLTGSIGVLGGKFNFAPASAKLGVNTNAVTRGQQRHDVRSVHRFHARTAAIRSATSCWANLQGVRQARLRQPPSYDRAGGSDRAGSGLERRAGASASNWSTRSATSTRRLRKPRSRPSCRPKSRCKSTNCP